MRGRKAEVMTLLRAHGLSLLAFVSITYMYEEYKYSRLAMIYFATIGGVALVSFRIVLRTFLRSLRRRGHNLRYVLMVGDGRAAQHLVERLAAYPEIGLRVAGMVTEDGSSLPECFGVPVLGISPSSGRWSRVPTWTRSSSAWRSPSSTISTKSSVNSGVRPSAFASRWTSRSTSPWAVTSRSSRACPSCA